MITNNFIPVLFFFMIILDNSIAQNLNLNVQGHSKIVGRLDLSWDQNDSTTLVIGKDAGINLSHSENLTNTIVGWRAGLHNVSAKNNTYFGAEAGHQNTQRDNSFFGRSAGYANITGSKNAFFGTWTGSDNNGTHNSFYGFSAGSQSKGSFNSFLGYHAGNSTVDSVNYSIAIGYRSKVDCSSCAVLGGTGDYGVYVGIGLTLPTRRLQIHDDLGPQNYLKLTSTQTGTLSQDGLDIGIDSNGHARINFLENHDLHLATNATDHLTIQPDGKVGIGTSSPSNILEVDGAASNGVAGFTRSDLGGDKSHILFGGTGDWYIRPSLSTGKIIIADHGGNVGIGTDMPQEILHIDNGNTANIRFTDSDASGGTKDWSIETSAPGFHIKDLSQASQDQFKISISGTSGDVGFGDPTPDADLDVERNGTYSHLNAGDATFTVSSSRRLKENISPLVIDGLVDKILQVKVKRYDWKPSVYSGQEQDRKDKLGLIAEDFHTILGRGNDKEINTNEVIMVLWMAVQELSKRLDELSGTNH